MDSISLDKQLHPLEELFNRAALLSIISFKYLTVNWVKIGFFVEYFRRGVLVNAQLRRITLPGNEGSLGRCTATSSEHGKMTPELLRFLCFRYYERLRNQYFSALGAEQITLANL
uniref:Uncharacterized protein n=1 Tax=Romanomermis culicivorax TaxID=13658 RepID=A0A915KCE9_ROMCU